MKQKGQFKARKEFYKKRQVIIDACKKGWEDLHNERKRYILWCKTAETLEEYKNRLCVNELSFPTIQIEDKLFQFRFPGKDVTHCIIFNQQTDFPDLFEFQYDSGDETGFVYTLEGFFRNRIDFVTNPKNIKRHNILAFLKEMII